MDDIGDIDVAPTTDRIVLCDHDRWLPVYIGLIALTAAHALGLLIAMCMSRYTNQFTVFVMAWTIAVLGMIGIAAFIVHLYEVAIIFPEWSAKVYFWILSFCLITTAVPCGCVYFVPGWNLELWALGFIVTCFISLLIGCTYCTRD
jgi:hypothetical protein